jgi:hypothetical protein
MHSDLVPLFREASSSIWSTVGGKESVLVRSDRTKGDSIMTTKAKTGIALVLATLLASPAFAHFNSTTQRDAYRAYGQQTEDYRRSAQDSRPYSSNPAWDVYSSRGRYRAYDPDPNVRDMLARDPEQRGW